MAEINQYYAPVGYVAVAELGTEDNLCDGCHLLKIVKKGCSVCSLKSKRQPVCWAAGRKDGQNVIFIKQHG
jgi:hypothetical protein